MNSYRILIFFIIVSIGLSSCTVSKQVNQLSQKANTAYLQADFDAAFEAYQEIINVKTSRNKAVEGGVFLNAGLSAWEIKETVLSIEYLENAKQTPALNSKTLYTLALAYLEIDNLSREILNLEAYVDNYPNGNEIAAVGAQLFLAYVKSLNWDKAKVAWGNLEPSYQNDEKYMVGLLKVNKGLGDNELNTPIAQNIIRINPDNLDALEVLAESYYQIAENSYQKEMHAYEKNRTTRQYRQLLAALEVINGNFRTSRDYFERLYKIEPNPRYANYLGNIYTRFDNKQQAAYYYRKAKVE